jgi:hypothetical protein
MVEPYLYSPTFLHGVVINQWNTRTTVIIIWSKTEVHKLKWRPWSLTLHDTQGAPPPMLKEMSQLSPHKSCLVPRDVSAIGRWNEVVPFAEDEAVSSLFCYMTWLHLFFTSIFCTIWKPNSVPMFLFNPLRVSFLYFTLSLQVCRVTVCSCGLEARLCITGVSYKFLGNYNFSIFLPHRPASTIFTSMLYPFYTWCHCRLRHSLGG